MSYGSIYIDLRGYDCDQPVCAADALAGFLRSLGVAEKDIPAGLDERSARFRSLADGRRLLILLDNAASLEQVRPLLPGTSTCTVLVTSRDRLAGLVARHGARRLDLDLLPSADAIALLCILIGDRVDAEPAAAATLADQCSRLPLALRVAAELAAIRRTMPLELLVSELADEQKRLDLLDADGDARTAVRAVLSWSCRHLTSDAVRAFRLLSLHPAPGFGCDAAAALLGSTFEQAGHMLDVLSSAHLVQSVRDGRYGMHDLLRAYARSLAQENDTREPLRRMLDYYLAAAAAAMDRLGPAERHGRPPVPADTVATPDFPDEAAARAWLDAERATLNAVTALAAVNAWPEYATRLAATLFRYLDGGRCADAVVMHSHAHHAAFQAGDRAAQAAALCDLGVAEWRLGRMSLAVGHHREALAIFRKIGDSAGQARALGNLGLVYWQQGRYQEAARHLRQAQALFRQVGDQTGEARALTNRGIIDWQLGRHCAAARHHERALALYRERGNRHGEACALGNLGSVYLAQRRFAAAAELQQQSLDLSHDLGHQVGEARAMSDIGAIYHQQGLLLAAADQLRQALLRFRDLGYRAGETEALIRLGEVQIAAGEIREAQAHFVAALGLSAQLGQVYEQGRAYMGLGHCHRSNGDTGQARQHWELALALLARLGLPDADEARASLATLELHAARPRDRAALPRRPETGHAP